MSSLAQARPPLNVRGPKKAPSLRVTFLLGLPGHEFSKSIHNFKHPALLCPEEKPRTSCSVSVSISIEHFIHPGKLLAHSNSFPRSGNVRRHLAASRIIEGTFSREPWEALHVDSSIARNTFRAIIQLPFELRSFRYRCKTFTATR